MMNLAYEDFFSQLVPSMGGDQFYGHRSDLSTTNTSGINGATSTTKGEEDPEERAKRKRVSQNQACRNYRKKKKEYTQNLETRIAELEHENQILKTKISVDSSRSEYKSAGLDMISREMKQFFAQLEDAFKAGDDKNLSYLLSIFPLIMDKTTPFYEDEINSIVNPQTQASLVKLGYFSQPEIVCPHMQTGYWDKMLQVANITTEQAAKMDEIRLRVQHDLGEILEERRSLDRDVKKFCIERLKYPPGPSSGQAPYAPNLSLDASEMLDFSRKMSLLKKNFLAQKAMFLGLTTPISKILTPRQHAMILLSFKAVRDLDAHLHIQALQNTWQLFESKTAAPLFSNIAPK